MPTPAELRAKFWDALGSDMTMMLGLDGVEDGHARPMTVTFPRPCLSESSWSGAPGETRPTT
jgi:hypothetical protein